MIATEHISPSSFKVRLRPNPRNLSWNFKNRMRNLTGDHVDFIGVRNRDHHVGVFRACLLQNMWARSETDDTAHIKYISDFSD